MTVIITWKQSGGGGGISSWPCCWSRTVESCNLGIEIRHDPQSISVWFPRGNCL